MNSNFRAWSSPAGIGLLLLLILVGCGPAERQAGQAPLAQSGKSAADSTNPLPKQPPEDEQRSPAASSPAEKQGDPVGRDADQKVARETSLGALPKADEPASQQVPEAPAQPAPPADPLESPSQAAASEPPGFLREPEDELPFPFEIPANWKRLSDKEEIWIDSQEKLVAVKGRICLTRGLLEMLACPKGTKEHESIVATKPWAMYIHQALLLAGINPGKPVQWEPEYKPAEGPRLQIEVWYFNQQQELVKKNAKEMVRLVSDGSPLKIDWVFGGSKFITDPDGRELYAANGGELVCLSNFSSAMIDLPIPSTAEAGGLLFEANSEQVPPLNTPVLLVLKASPPEADAPPAGKTGEADQENQPVF